MIYFIEISNSPRDSSFFYIDGKRSEMIASKSGTSLEVNLGKLQSLIALKIRKASSSLGKSLFSVPAARIIDLIALKI
jgi:hypothetical protein